MEVTHCDTRHWRAFWPCIPFRPFGPDENLAMKGGFSYQHWDCPGDGQRPAGRAGLRPDARAVLSGGGGKHRCRR
eukprot:1069184-Rhodomonas_salina.1